MSTVTNLPHPSSFSVVEQPSDGKKRPHFDHDHTVTSKKRLKNALDITSHWKRIRHVYDNEPRKAFPCQSKQEYLIVQDPLDNDRSRFVIAKSSFYWLTESVRLMQNHVEYGTTFDGALNGEIIEIERNLKALKVNVEKNGQEKTYFYRAEALLHFIRLCSTLFDPPKEKYQRRLHSLFQVCTHSWLHMFDIILPTTIVRVQRSFLLDDDYEDFEQGSILSHYLKEEQTKIKKTNVDFPNLRHLLYSIICLLEKWEGHNLIDRVYLERFRMIYEVWSRIDNELNSRATAQRISTSRTASTKKSEQKISWNFLRECEQYEKTFGTFVSHLK